MRKVNVTKTFLPPLADYTAYLQKIWESSVLTNQGPILRDFEAELAKIVGTRKVHFVTNGTLALQLAVRALNLGGGEIITTPFTYVATVSAIMWEYYRPVFVDIDPMTLNMAPEKIEAAITVNTKAIMPVHVFGNPCDVQKIDAISRTHNLKVIYDAAHAFKVEYQGKALLNAGDASACSFHATKLFHTIEGGLVVAKEPAYSQRIELMKRFGHELDEHQMLGTNAKASEFQAAMGMANLPYIDSIIDKRRSVSKKYDSLLSNNSNVQKQRIARDTVYNHAYYPVIFPTAKMTDQVIKSLNSNNIFPRRYFYPSLNLLPYLENAAACPVSEDISQRIICLPLYPDLEDEAVEMICKLINHA